MDRFSDAARYSRVKLTIFSASGETADWRGTHVARTFAKIFLLLSCKLP